MFLCFDHVSIIRHVSILLTSCRSCDTGAKHPQATLVNMKERCVSKSTLQYFVHHPYNLSCCFASGIWAYSRIAQWMHRTSRISTRPWQKFDRFHCCHAANQSQSFNGCDECCLNVLCDHVLESLALEYTCLYGFKLAFFCLSHLVCQFFFQLFITGNITMSWH